MSRENRIQSVLLWDLEVGPKALLIAEIDCPEVCLVVCLSLNPLFYLQQQQALLSLDPPVKLINVHENLRGEGESEHDFERKRKGGFRASCRWEAEGGVTNSQTDKWEDGKR